MKSNSTSFSNLLREAKYDWMKEWVTKIVGSLDARASKSIQVKTPPITALHVWLGLLNFLGIFKHILFCFDWTSEESLMTVKLSLSSSKVCKNFKNAAPALTSNQTSCCLELFHIFMNLYNFWAPEAKKIYFKFCSLLVSHSKNIG